MRNKLASILVLSILIILVANYETECEPPLPGGFSYVLMNSKGKSIGSLYLKITPCSDEWCEWHSAVIVDKRTNVKGLAYLNMYSKKLSNMVNYKETLSVLRDAEQWIDRDASKVTGNERQELKPLSEFSKEDLYKSVFLIDKNDRHYHKEKCPLIKKSCLVLSLKKAREKGKYPCPICDPDD